MKKRKNRVLKAVRKTLESRKDIVLERIALIEKNGDDALLDFDAYIKNRKSAKYSKSMLNAG